MVKLYVCSVVFVKYWFLFERLYLLVYVINCFIFKNNIIVIVDIVIWIIVVLFVSSCMDKLIWLN